MGWSIEELSNPGEIKPCVILDPFSGVGTTGKASLELNRSYIGIELENEYNNIAEEELGKTLLHKKDDCFDNVIS